MKTQSLRGTLLAALFTVLAAVAAFAPGTARATSASPFSFTETQPDGSEVHLHLEGDEFFHHLRDTNGYTVLKDRGWFVYAERGKGGRLVPTGLRVGQADPGRAGLSENILPDAAIRNARREQMAAIQQAGGVASNTAPLAATVSGSLKNLVVLLRFSDHASRSVPPTTDIDVLMNAPGGDATLAPTGSVRDCFLENSYGQLSIDSTVAYWVTLPNTEAYYANGNSGLTTKTHEALKFALDTLDADSNFNFTDFDQDNDGNIDAITFLHSGYGAEWGGTSADGAAAVNRMWSHKWAISGAWFSSENVRVYDYHISPSIWGTSGTNIGRIGVICHETGHFLGLPDLYDGNDSDGDGRSGSGIGSYGLMANSWGFDGLQLYPPHMSIWSKAALGWVNPTVIGTPGTYSLGQAETNSAGYRINLGYPTGEYLLIENRQPVGLDSAMPQGGLAIFHIDEAAGNTIEGHPWQVSWPTNGNHYKVALLQADGAYDLERGFDRGDATDVYRGGNVNQISPTTVPNTHAYKAGNIIITNNRLYNISSSGPTMNFSFEVVGAPVPEPPAAPSSLAATAVSASGINLTWADNSTDESSFGLERSTGGSAFTEIASLGENINSFSDTGLNASTAYSYRVRARNSAGNSAYSTQASATTNAPPQPPAAPSGLTATATSDTAINLAWVDNSANEDGFAIDRSLDAVGWEIGVANLPANTLSFSDSGLNASTTYYYRVSAFNAQDSGTSDTASTTTQSAPAYEDAMASADWPVSGTVTGNYTDTHAAGEGRLETVTETISGGKPSRRRSFLDHRWSFANVRGGMNVSLFVKAYAPVNGENDDFEIQYSTNGGSTWSSFGSPLVIANGTTQDNAKVAVFPDGTKGNIDIRVIDTNSTAGATQRDSVVFDQLFIRTDIDPTDSPPDAPDNVIATVKSSSQIDITWHDNSDNERGFMIYRSSDGNTWSEVGSAAVDATSFSDLTASPATTYQFEVSAFSASFESISVASAEVTTPDGLSLTSLTGGKKKGKIYVDLGWSGGASLETVDIWRSVNGGSFTKVVANTSNDGNQRDLTGLKGSYTLTYQIRSTDGTVSSNSATISL